MATIRFNKIEAARRQLSVALDLWFADGDPLAVHTLVGASSRLLSDLLVKNGLSDPFLVDNASIRPEKRKEWLRVVRSTANFLKHADEDPGAEHELDPRENDLLLVQCISALRQLGADPLSVKEHAFWVRFGLEMPDVLVEPFATTFATEEFQAIAGMSRRDFYAAFKKTSENRR
jgi:hypothetical protein